jgi:hypothetical protein
MSFPNATCAAGDIIVYENFPMQIISVSPNSPNTNLEFAWVNL